MGGLERRLERLESGADTSTQEREQAVSRETLRRLTDDELSLCEALLKRQQRGERPTEEQQRFLSRYQSLREEVRGELAAQA